ncbi:hypothetical protein BDW02DRAFT_595466 [Decorospora gaudefroyi]|uniref:Pal1-domain-containing protein n=1 Tax=Decorospora gaudefroyi TaxID=184978 RepID=A0A6A5KNJ3_9PLEO|nr:hypothetical protein BDW02DRAFT_595466 [Decorospora gaudefroyi]
MAPNVDLTAQSPPARMPKLKYRTPLPTDSPSLASSSSHGTGPHTASIISHPSCETASLTSSSLASISSSASSDDSKSSKKKKKGSSVLGFLSLKEPSQVALEQFAEQQRKQNANSKGASTPQSKASSNSNYVGQKLPPNVPKVNSKWDGVPSSVKQQSSSTSTKDKRRSATSQNSLGSTFKNYPWNDSRVSVMTDGTRNPPNSIASTSMADLRKGAGALKSSPSTTTLPEISYFFPDEPVASGALPSPSVNADSNQETAAQASTRLSNSTSSDRPSMDGSVDSRPASPASSTSSTDTIVRDTADVIFKKLNEQPSPRVWGDSAPAVQSPDGGIAVHVPDSHNFLFDPQPVMGRPQSDPPKASPPIPHYAPKRPVQNFSRPMVSRGPPPVQRSAQMPPYRRAPSASALPTLYEASLASTDDGAEDDDSHSIAPSTIAASELSQHWYESPRERLGLGRRLQINDASPWEDQGESAGKPKKNRLSMFGRRDSKG